MLGRRGADLARHKLSPTCQVCASLQRPLRSLDCTPPSGPSRQYYSSSYVSIDRKGKQPDRSFHGLGGQRSPSSLLSSSLGHSRWRQISHRRQHGLNAIIIPYRAFHASEPRNALPLIPAGLGILKSTSVLAGVTAVSRVLISFLPIGTLITLRMNRGLRWVAEETTEPEISPKAWEFWKMWCEDERSRRPNQAEATELMKGKIREDGGVEDPSGRIAWGVPMPVHWGRGAPRRQDGTFDPFAMLEAKGFNLKRVVHFVKHSRFFLPPLPSAAELYFERLTPEEQLEVMSMRKYYASLQLFKDGLRRSRWIMGCLLGIPFLLLCCVYLFGLERTPLTGRWRIILLSPEEEETISNSLSGGNWYKSVINLLTTVDGPAPPVISPEDWRWIWVTSTLRRLEAGMLSDYENKPSPYGSPLIPVPKAEYPIKPRPRMSWMLHSALPGNEPTAGLQHLEIGPPYSLMIMEKSERNAFSYGFGGKGAGGVVIYTGLLDEILKSDGPEIDDSKPRSGGLFSGLFSSPQVSHPVPTDTQTLRLASVLAHEMGHLVLSHHLETLSQQQVLWPSLLGFSVDILRAFVWPITIFLGPTVNDALANLGRTSADEVAERYGQIGFQWKHEYEADLAGLRFLGLAGFNPRTALSHFSASVAELQEIQPLSEKDDSWTSQLFRFWTRTTHPSPEQRAKAIEEELDRWERESEPK